MKFKTLLRDFHILRSVFLCLFAFALFIAPITAKLAGMGSRVEICTGFGAQWVMLEDEDGHFDHCSDCIAVAPLSGAIMSANFVPYVEVHSYAILLERSERFAMLARLANKDPPLKV